MLGELQSRFGYLTPRAGLVRRVGETRELARIRDLPRRDWRTSPHLAELVRLLTLDLRDQHAPGACPDGCLGCKARELKPAQAQSLAELTDGTGLFLPLRIGAGKTLVSLLAASVLKEPRVVLVVPAASVRKTELEARQYGRHWRIMPHTLVSYETLSAPKQVNWLEQTAPRLLICDEAHKLKNTSSKAWKRISRYLKAHPECRLVCLSGSVMSRSILEYAHYLRAGLRSLAPVPRDLLELRAWSYALDEKVPPEAVFEPGALLTLAPPGLGTVQERARGAYRDRLLSTPGVVSTREEVPSCGLEIRLVHVPSSPVQARLLQDLRAKWETPCGDSFSLALDLWRHARSIGCGLYMRWDPPAPEFWLKARREWHAYVRDRLKFARTWDSQVHLIGLIKSGQAPDGERVYQAWQACKDQFRPNPVAEWVDGSVLARAIKWAQDRPMPLVWVEHREFGERMSRESGLPFFADQARDQQGRLLGLEYVGPAIASQHSCWQNLNLQAWHENLIVSPSSKGDRWNQLLGRTHRDGQEADTVSAEVWLTTPESVACWEQACRDGLATEQLKGEPHRLVYAERVS